MGAKLQWGLLSTARINRRIIPPLKTSSRSALVGVASRDADRARLFAARWKIPKSFDSYDALLQSPEINAVYIPLPNQFHCEWVLRAARSGKHILCEKPLALTVAEVDAMIAAARKNRVVILEGIGYRMHPQFDKLKIMIRQGLIGEVRLIRAYYSFTLLEEAENIRWRKDLGGGSLWDVGCYPVSFARAVLGVGPLEVFARQVVGSTGVDIRLAGQLKYSISAQRGGPVLVQMDCGFCLPFRVGAEVVGGQGVIVVPNPWRPDVDGRKSGLIHVAPDDIETVYSTEIIDPYLCEIQTMERAVLDDVSPPYSLEESKDNIAAICALYKSAASGNPVKVDL